MTQQQCQDLTHIISQLESEQSCVALVRWLGSNDLICFETCVLVLPICPNMITERLDITLIRRLGNRDSTSLRNDSSPPPGSSNAIIECPKYTSHPPFAR